MILNKFNTPMRNPGKRFVDTDKLAMITSLLQRRYKQREICEMMGMTPSALNDYMAYHGLRRVK